MGRTLVLGDVHGAARALEQVLERSKFDRANDVLIFLGDVADGWPETRQAINLLLTIPNRISLLGNHDEWFKEWVETGKREPLWTSQGGQATIDSYAIHNPDGYVSPLDCVPDTHRRYLRYCKEWHSDGDRMFVHGGWPMASKAHPEVYAGQGILNWDRGLWQRAKHAEAYGMRKPFTRFDEVYVGHTTTWAYSRVPMQACEVWNLDQGAGWEGKLSIMDVDTKEYWQSDLVSDLYPDVQGRH